MRVLSALLFGAFYASTGLGCNEGEVDLLVTVVNAHVKSADVNGGKSDPFAKVTIGSHTHHTSTVEDNNSPVWDETLHYACANTSQPIHVTVWDRDPVKYSDLLMYSDLPDWTTVAQDSEIKLYNKNKDEAEYYVNIKISWTVEENCPSTCWGEYTCDYWDTNYGFLDGVCDKAGSDLSQPPGSTEGNCDCTGCACNQQSECAAYFTLHMMDSFGDGWSNNYWTWSTGGAQLDSGTLASGASGTAELCIFYEAFACYTLAVSDEGTFASEISWRIDDTDGTTELASGGAPGSAYVCTDDLCDGDLLQVTMHDSFGDGWNGNTLEIRDCDGNSLAAGITLEDGADGTAHACVPTKNAYDVVVGGGTWGYEISWAVVDLSTGTDIASGGSPFEGGTCSDPVAEEDDAAACTATCMAYDCDWYDEHYGYTDGICDYYGQSLTELSCDCSGCNCDTGAAVDDDGCSEKYTLVMTDTSGDGWDTGDVWKWSTEAGVLLSSGTLSNPPGQTDTAELCMLYEEFSCYVLSLDATGTWASEIGWDVEDADGTVLASGGAMDSATLCTEELCDGDVLHVAMHDSFGDGWNGNTMTISGCPGTDAASTVFADGLTITVADGGVDKTRTVCIPAAANGKYRVVVNGGSGPSEVSWTIYANNVDDPELTGGAPYDSNAVADGGLCPAVADDDGGDDGGSSNDADDELSSSTCAAADCIGHTCDYWNDNFGENEADCDYYGSDIVQTYGCSCLGCGCLTSDCEKSYTLNMFDSRGEGWDGATWSWAANIGLQTGTLSSGSTGSAKLCLYANKFACYTLTVVAGPEHASAVSWQIATSSGKVIQEGGAPATVHQCDACPAQNTVLQIDLEDSFGDGWQGDVLTIYDCDSGAVLADGITLEFGSSDTQWACIPTGYNPDTYAFKMSGGSNAGEITFTVSDWLTGVVLVTGDGHYNGGNCGAPAPANAPTRSPSAFGSPTPLPYIPVKTPKPTHSGGGSGDDDDDKASISGASGTPTAVVVVLVIFFLGLACGGGFYWWKKGAPTPGWCKKEPQLARYQNVGRWSFSPGTTGGGGGGGDGAEDDSTSPGRVVTFNALRGEIASKESDLGSGKAIADGTKESGGGGYMAPSVAAGIIGGEHEDDTGV